MVRLNRQQRVALHRVWQRDTTVAANYRAFRRTVHPGPGCVLVRWAGMWLGIEPDGYTHS